MSGKQIIVSALVLLLTLVLSAPDAMAQSADDVLRYSLQYPSYDAESIVMPSVAHPAGFGSFQENPASMALFDESFFSFGLSNRTVNEQTTYLGNRSEFSENQLNVGDIGFVYRLPTVRGSMVIGGGYSQTSDFNRALAASGFNDRSTVTDFLNITSDDSLFFAAFDAYAIDYATVDSSYSETASIFRVGLPDYFGVAQNVEMVERGVMGEYSAFFATEFQQNLMMGVSIGVISGTYDYKREFLETDRDNNYNFDFIDSDGDGTGDTDIDNILVTDTITSTLNGFTARVGMLYRPTPFLSVGASYQFKNKLKISEDYNTQISTIFDNGVEFFDDAPGTFDYRVVRPDRLNAGLSLRDVSGLTLSVAAEYVRYSSAGIEFDGVELAGLEQEINRTVRSNLNDVVNLRAGVEIEMNPLFTPRLGYAWFPSPTKDFDSSRQFFSTGFSTRVFDNVVFDLGVQYSMWEDRNQLYQYDNGTAIAGEVTTEDVSRWNVMGGVKIGF